VNVFERERARWNCLVTGQMTVVAVNEWGELQSNGIVMAVEFEVEMIVNERRVEADEEERLCVGVVRIRGRWYCSVQ